MKNIVWLASYPKSGNTWIRSVLSLAIYKNLDINNFRILSLNAIIKEKEPNLKIQKPGDTKFLWDEIQQKISKEVDQNRIIIKTHNLCANFGEVQFPNLNFTSKLIYIVRDPRDVAISYGNHFGHTLERAIELIMKDNNFIFNVKDNLAEVISSWDNHVKSWATSNISKIVIRYEDLILDPKNNLEKLFLFLKIKPLIPIDKIILKTSFKSLQNIEIKKGFKEAPNRDRIFFRSGKMAEYQKYDQNVFAPLTSKYKDIMNKFGYE